VILGLDHLVILVENLAAAVAGYEAAGFRVTPGGEHADGLTRNALVPFADGTYLELVEFVDPSDPRDNVWGWRAFLPRGGLVDHCALSDDLSADARRLRNAGMEIDGPDEGGRRLPGGEEIRWKSARVHQKGRVLPFLIEDVTPRETRVPTGAATEHPNGATGIRRLYLATRNVVDAEASLAALTDAKVPGNASRLGRHELTFVTPEDLGVESRDAAERLDRSGPGPFAVEFEAAGRSLRPERP
jgi:hypothetical protein